MRKPRFYTALSGALLLLVPATFILTRERDVDMTRVSVDSYAFSEGFPMSRSKEQSNDHIRSPRDVDVDDFIETLQENLEARKTSSKKGIYVAEAFRVADDEIRLVYLQDSNNRRPLVARVNNHWKEVESTCFNRTTCEDYLFCSMGTRFGTIKLPSDTASLATIPITAKGAEEFYPVKVRDVRMKTSDYPHQVGVCLQPLFFYTDWTLLVQFFESWLAQGATKFYVYYHSYTRQSAEVLAFYQSQLGTNLELIAWSNLPSHERDRGDYYADPNSRVFRHAATAFMHDCVLRARSNVKYIANFDLDDFPVAIDQNIGKQLDDIIYKDLNAAAIVMDWFLSKQPLNWDHEHTPNDVSFNLGQVRILQNDSIRWDYRISKKIFLRPERVMHFDMHSIYENELIPGSTAERFTTTNAFGSNKMYLLHLRRFERHMVNDQTIFNTTYNNDVLVNLERKMMENYRNRIKGTSFARTSMSPWASEARETLRNLEQCRREAFGVLLTDKNKVCQQSSAGCDGMLMAGTRFITAPITWVDVAHEARFNNYLSEDRKKFIFF